MRKLLYLFFIIVPFILISCDLDVPITEMVKAKKSITRAYEVKADKYDNENLDKALEHLNKSQAVLMDKKVSDAKKAAIESHNYATAAIMNSLPKLAGDTLSEAMKLYEETEKLYAEKYAPEQFQLAEKYINEADNLKSEKKYWKSYLKSKDAITAGNAAKSTSLEKVPVLKEEITAKKDDIEKLRAASKDKALLDDLSTAETGLDKAETLLTDNNVKAAVKEMADADVLIGNVKLKVTKLTAKERIEKLRKEAEALKKQRGSEFANEDIEIVISTLNEADTLLDQEKVDQALVKIADAENSFKIARQKTIKGIAEDKYSTLTKLLKETRNKDKKKNHEKELAQVEDLINDGKNLLDSESYDDALAQFEKAESQLNTISVAVEKEYLKDKDIPGSIDFDKNGGKVYVVKYRRKDTDCLWRIAHKIYRKASLWPLIYMANKDRIKDPDLIFPGQKFRIPPRPAKKTVVEIKEKKVDEKVEEDKKQ